LKYSLQSLSFRQCPNVDSELVEKANKTIWHIPEVFLPSPLRMDDYEDFIEVDPEYVM
jgi:hypothetical protein